MSHQNWIKTLLGLLKELREEDFTGKVTIRMNKGGISEIRKEETVNKEYREG